MWPKAVELLTPKAYFLLSVLWLKDIKHITRSILADRAKVGETTLNKLIKELTYFGYLHVKQTGRATFRYYVGEGVTDGKR
jgi:DNA-binding transcriptional regulator LsrR (DeoR family)